MIWTIAIDMTYKKHILFFSFLAEKSLEVLFSIPLHKINAIIVDNSVKKYLLCTRFNFAVLGFELTQFNSN